MKNTYKFYAFLLAIPLAGFLFVGYSSGQTAPYSGSPGDNGNTCAVCHSGSTDHNAVATISTTITDGYYTVNQDYAITVSVTSDMTKHGFQLTAEKAGGIKVGEFVAGTGNQVTNSSHNAVTHTYAGSAQTSWTFTWTSPATDEGPITFYAAVNATNANNSDSGDQVVTTSLSVQSAVGVATYKDLAFSVYPNPAHEYLQLETSNTVLKDATLHITDLQGKTVITQNFIKDAAKIDVSKLSKGVYLLNITSGDKAGVRQFIKE